MSNHENNEESVVFLKFCKINGIGLEYKRDKNCIN